MLQAVRPAAAGNERFIEMIAAQTFQADASGSLLAKKREIDFVLRLAGTTQISAALSEEGARPGEPFLLIIANRTPVKGTRDVKKSELPRRKLSIEELIRVEKAALLSAKRV